MKSFIKVKKRDGSYEDYDSNKIKRVVIAAGLTEEKAQILCDKIDSWASKLKQKSVTSIEIKDRVTKEIDGLDKYASEKYAWYEAYKDKMYSDKK